MADVKARSSHVIRAWLPRGSRGRDASEALVMLLFTFIISSNPILLDTPRGGVVFCFEVGERELFQLPTPFSEVSEGPTDRIP